MIGNTITHKNLEPFYWFLSFKIVFPQNSYVEALIPNTAKCDGT